MVKGTRRVLVTREAQAASRTAHRLLEAGFEPVLIPLQAVRRLHPGLPPAPRFDLAAATSANALANLPAELALHDLPIFCVGARTTGAACQAGFASIRTGPGTARDLARLIIAETPAGARLAYLCGRIRRPDLEVLLRDAGIVVEPIATYAMEPLTPHSAALEALVDRPPEAALVYSVEGARALLALLDRLPPKAAQAIRPVCLSGEVAAVFAGRSCTVANQPTEDALIAALGLGSGTPPPLPLFC